MSQLISRYCKNYLHYVFHTDSLRPRGDAAAAAVAGAGAGEDAGGDGGAASLRASFNSVYEAMQDLLGNLHLPEIPQDGADSEDSDDEYEWQ